MATVIAPASKRSKRKDSESAPATTPVVEVTPPPKRRRQPAMVAAAVAAICLGALLSVWAYTSQSNAHEVIAVRTTVHRGEVISRDDLVSARISVDPALNPIAAAEIDSVVGQRAALDLAAGGLLTREDIASSVVPGKGMSVVGVNLAPGMIPAEPLQAGDQVRVIATPGPQGDVGAEPPAAIEATVVGVRLDNGQTVVDVSVPYADAAELAARAATGKVALVLDSRER